jgi:NADPH:quinone reductase-like Zn-dependent oxidoreductase
MQEYMVLSQGGVVKAPRHLDAVQAATLPCAAVTAWNALVTQGPIKAGDVVLVQGTGGVSLFALLFAKMHGARVIATSSSDAKLERVKAMGADHVVNYKTTPEWHKVAREVTDGVGVDLVVEVGGAGTLESSLRAVRISGTVALIGVLSGATSQLGLGAVVTQNIRLQGITVGSRAVFEDMARAMELHRTVPPIDDRLFVFEEVGPAIKAMPSGQHFGKICCRF